MSGGHQAGLVQASLGGNSMGGCLISVGRSVGWFAQWPDCIESLGLPLLGAFFPSSPHQYFKPKGGTNL
jgi:hypothetical protein